MNRNCPQASNVNCLSIFPHFLSNITECLKKKAVRLRKLLDGELKEDAQLQFQAQLSPPGIAS